MFLCTVLPCFASYSYGFLFLFFFQFGLFRTVNTWLSLMNVQLSHNSMTVSQNEHWSIQTFHSLHLPVLLTKAYAGRVLAQHQHTNPSIFTAAILRQKKAAAAILCGPTGAARPCRLQASSLISAPPFVDELIQKCFFQRNSFCPVQTPSSLPARRVTAWSVWGRTQVAAASGQGSPRCLLYETC